MIFDLVSEVFGKCGRSSGLERSAPLVGSYCDNTASPKLVFIWLKGKWSSVQ